MSRLRRSNCAAPGIARRRRGRGFEYRDPAGERIADPEVLERIAGLAIPPAWREVWICMDARGHLQATGVDAAGRKQYLYHERWRTNRDRQKFDSMLAFGAALPALRRHVGRDLKPEASAELTRERVLACAVRLLDVGFFRIGSEDYAERNESYGLSTMLREHVTIEDGQLVFDFPAKSGQRRVQEITDPDALGIVAALKRRRSGAQLLAHRDSAPGSTSMQTTSTPTSRKPAAARSPQRTSAPGTPPCSPPSPWPTAESTARRRLETALWRAPSRRWLLTSEIRRRSAAPHMSTPA
jgi:DNA topoisomerase I